MGCTPNVHIEKFKDFEKIESIILPKLNKEFIILKREYKITKKLKRLFKEAKIDVIKKLSKEELCNIEQISIGYEDENTMPDKLIELNLNR